MISNLLLGLNSRYNLDIDSQKYCNYLIEYPLSDIIDFDWKKILPDPPLNSSAETQKDLLEVSKESNKRTKEETQLVLSIDDNANYLIYKIIDKYNLVFPNVFFNDFYSIVKPIIFNTKYYYNRARPFQLANFYNVKIDTINTLTHHTPSYPSGHTVYTSLASMILSKLYPKLKSEFDNIVQITSDSRIKQGVHFRSDTEASIKLTQFLYDKLNPKLEKDYHGKIL